MKPHHPDWITLAEEGRFEEIYFLYIDWPTGPVYLHSYLGTIQHAGQEWNGVGIIGEIESNGASTITQKPVLTLRLSRLPEEALGLITPDDATGRDAVLRVGAKDPDTAEPVLVADHTELSFSGRIGSIDMDFSEGSVPGEILFDYIISIEYGKSPRLPILHRHSDADQRRRTAADPLGACTGFRFLAVNFAKTTIWTP